MSNWRRVEFTDGRGVPRLVLLPDGEDDPEVGIPLLDLGAVELPQDIEDEVIKHLWGLGIKEYADALQPGANERIMSALRGALKLAVGAIVTVCRDEYTLLEANKHE